MNKKPHLSYEEAVIETDTKEAVSKIHECAVMISELIDRNRSKYTPAEALAAIVEVEQTIMLIVAKDPDHYKETFDSLHSLRIQERDLFLKDFFEMKIKMLIASIKGKDK